MTKMWHAFKSDTSRRSFLKNGTVAGAATVGAGLLAGNTLAFGREDDVDRAPITRGDLAILRFLQALEQVEEDLWRQYAELGGTQDNEFSGLTGGKPPYPQTPQIPAGAIPPYIPRKTHATNNPTPVPGHLPELN